MDESLLEVPDETPGELRLRLEKELTHRMVFARNSPVKELKTNNDTISSMLQLKRTWQNKFAKVLTLNNEQGRPQTTSMVSSMRHWMQEDVLSYDQECDQDLVLLHSWKKMRLSIEPGVLAPLPMQLELRPMIKTSLVILHSPIEVKLSEMESQALLTESSACRDKYEVNFRDKLINKERDKLMVKPVY